MKKNQSGFVIFGFLGGQALAAIIGMTMLATPPLIGQAKGNNHLTSATGAIHASNGDVTVKE